jgi:tRNA pseudouridine-54 N-methylase
MNLETFDAKEAKRIVDTNYLKRLNAILQAIQQEAEEGKSVFYVEKRPLEVKARQALIDRGFIIADHPTVINERENLFQTIYWNEPTETQGWREDSTVV